MSVAMILCPAVLLLEGNTLPAHCPAMLKHRRMDLETPRACFEDRFRRVSILSKPGRQT